jgi:O-antigen ligase/tetratricopeptide (TPR) repeat protein
MVVVLAVLVLLPFLLGKVDVSDQTTHRPHFIIHVLLYLGLGAVLIRTYHVSRITYHVSRLEVPLAALVLLSALSCLTSVNRYVSVVATLRLLDGALLAWLVAQVTPRTRLQVLWLAMAGVGAVVAMMGVREYLESVLWQHDPQHKIFATFFNNNCLAAWLLLVLPLAVGLIWTLDDRHPVVAGLAAREVAYPAVKLRMLALLVVGLLLAALFLTQSKGGFLGFVGAAVAFIVGLKWAGRLTFNLRFILGGLLVLVLLGGLVARSPLGHRFAKMLAGEKHSTIHRLLTWQGTGRMFLAHPLLGTGPGTFEYAYPQYAAGSFTAQAHNTFLQTAAEMGVGALGAFLWLLFAVGRECVRAARTQEDPLRALAGTAGLAALTGLVLHNLVDYGWSVPAVRLTWLALAGLVVATRSEMERPAASRGGHFPFGPIRLIRPIYPTGFHFPFSISAIILALLLLLSVPLLRAAVAEHWLAIGPRLWSEGAAASSIRALEKAIAWAPGNGDAYRELAKCLFTRSQGQGRRGGASVPAPGDYRRALVLLEQAIARQPTFARNYYLLGYYHEAEDEEEEALRWYSRAVEYDPLSIQVWLRLAQTQEKQGREREAEAAYRRVVEIQEGPVGQTNPIPEYRVEDVLRYGEALVALGRLAQAQGKSAAARKLLQRGVDALDQFLQWQANVERMLKQESSPEKRQDLNRIYRYDPQEAERVRVLREEAEAWKEAWP